MSAPGSLRIVGLGPGSEAWITSEALDLIANATDLVGYGPYLERLPPNRGRGATKAATGLNWSVRAMLCAWLRMAAMSL